MSQGRDDLDWYMSANPGKGAADYIREIEEHRLAMPCIWNIDRVPIYTNRTPTSEQVNNYLKTLLSRETYERHWAQDSHHLMDEMGFDEIIFGERIEIKKTPNGFEWCDGNTKYIIENDKHLSDDEVFYGIKVPRISIKRELL